MGITGLIPFLEKASSKVHLKDLRGTAVAVDTYCWLHKGVFSCAEKLVRGEETDQYLRYCLRYVEMLLSYDIKPILVFDGRHLPAKAQTERRRRDARKQSKQRAAELLRLGRIDEARTHMRRCVDVTHEMALKLIRECHKRNVDCIVAPYEADAQMAWLNKVNLVKYVVTEDSDLTLFGAQNIIFKLDLTGAGLLVESDKLHVAMGCPKPKFTFERFLRMCILSGCDYLDSLPGIGLAKACKFILMTEENDMKRALKKIPQYLNMRQLEVTDDYIENFLKAEATFRHMYIFNTFTRKMERLHALEEYATELRYCENAGTLLENEEQALQLAWGNLNPFTFKQMDNWHPDRNFGLGEALPKQIKRAKHKSIWQGNFTLQQSPMKSLNSKSTNQKQQHCALFFKKINLKQTIDHEYSANLEAENAKPMEAEIYTMYKQEAALVEGKRKRVCSSTKAEDDLDDGEDDDEEQTDLGLIEEEEQELASNIKSKQQHHNPFAKSTAPAIVCANASLLRALSPRKNKIQSTNSGEQEAGSTASNRTPTLVKRNIFDKIETRIQVRSRFFATNLTQIKPTPLEVATAINTTKELAEEFDKVDQLSQQNQLQQTQLYDCNSPSPRKRPRLHLEQVQTEQTDEEKQAVKCYAESECNDNYASSPAKLNEADSGDINKQETAIILSDCSDDEAKPTTNSLVNRFSNFQATQNMGRRRLGLSKTTSSGSQLKSTKSASKSSMTANKNVEQSQTRLSMFGFQKRPMLRTQSK